MVIGIDASRAFVENPAGPEYYSLNIIQNIAKLDQSNTFVLYLREGQKVNFKLPQNFSLKYIRLPYLWTQIGLAFETIFHSPDALFISAHTVPVMLRLLKPSVKTVVTIHGLEGKYLPQSGNYFAHIYRNWSISAAVRFSDGLIAVSRNTMADVINTYHIPSNKIKLIYEGVDYERFSKPNFQFLKVKARYNLPNRYLLFVGTVQPRKNLIRLIKAVARIPRLHLVIAGKLGWLYEDILVAPKRYGVFDRVHFIGRVDDIDLPAIYHLSSAFILPSETEGFGLPVLEAQAAGRPVIVSKTGALPEVAGNGAIFINPFSVTSIEKGILKVFQNRLKRVSIIRKGRQNAKKFKWSYAASSTLNFLKDIASK